MDEKTTPLIGFNKNANYYQSITKLDDLIKKTIEIKTLEEIHIFINIARSYIFSDETLKSIFLNNIGENYKNSEEKQNEIENNTNALIGYLERAGYQYSISNPNVIHDITNGFLNIIDKYFFPSFYKFAEEKLKFKIEDYLIEEFLTYDCIIDDMEYKIGLSVGLYQFFIYDFDNVSFENIAKYNTCIDDNSNILDCFDYSIFYYKMELLNVFNKLKFILEDYYCPQYYNFPEKNNTKNTKLDETKKLLINNPHLSYKELAQCRGVKPDTIKKQIQYLCIKYQLPQQNKTTLIEYLLSNKEIF